MNGRGRCIQRTEDVSGQDSASRKACWARLGRVYHRGRESTRNRRAPHLGMAPAAHGPLDHDVPAFVLLHGKSVTTGFGTIPAASTMVSASMLPARWTLPGSMDRTGGVCPDLHPRPPGEDPGSIIRQLRIDFRHDPVAALEQQQADLASVTCL